jgi:hypothetical protein
MFAQYRVRMVLALAMFASPCALAEALNLEVGAWEISTTTVMSGQAVPDSVLAQMPAEQRARMAAAMAARSANPTTTVTKSCMTQADLDRNSMLDTDDEGQCTQKVLSDTASKVEMQRTCTAPASQTTMTIEAPTRHSTVATMDMTRGEDGAKVHMEMHGKWLGTSCAGIDDD